MTAPLPRAALTALLAPAAFAAEGGTGFCLLGTRAIKACVAPPPGTYVQTGLYAYSGMADAHIPDSGALQLGLKGRVALGLFTGLWAPASEPILGGRPYLLLTVPVGWKESKVSATLTRPNGDRLNGQRTEDSFLLGDPVLGAGLGWGTGPWFSSLNLLVNVPVGDYSVTRSTNVSFNRWGADLTAATTWMRPEGWQADFAVNLTVNGKNLATDYKTGNELHFEAAAAKKLGGWTLGLAGYYYQQVTGDSGEGAILGDFESRVAALGPVASWSGAWSRQPRRPLVPRIRRPQPGRGRRLVPQPHLPAGRGVRGMTRGTPVALSPVRLQRPDVPQHFPQGRPCLCESEASPCAGSSPGGRGRGGRGALGGPSPLTPRQQVARRIPAGFQPRKNRGFSPLQWKLPHARP